MKSKWRYGTLAGAVAAVLGGGAGTAQAAGFFLPYQGAAAIGNSLAGTAALGEDASTVYWNPAAMSRLQESQIAIAGHYSAPTLQFSNNGSTGPAAIVPATGGNGGDAGVPTLIPNLFGVLRLNDNWALGVAVSPTFGNRTEYDPTWRGRFQSTESELMATNVNPSLSYKWNDWSFGVGINYTRLEAEFHQRVVLGVNTEGNAKLSGDDTALSANVGALWEMTSQTRFGFSYRSKIDFQLAGTQQVATLTGVAVPGQNFDIRADLTLPAIATVSAVHEFTDQWAVLADFSFTQWSEINQLAVKNLAGTTVNTLAFELKDTVRGSLAVNYDTKNNWLLRAGIAFDQSPVKGALERTASLPDSDRIWLSLGARWDIVPKKHRLDFAYAHVFVEASEIGRTTTGTSGMTLKGNYDNSADILSAQYTFSF
jgi:long-chain fatty acid transport protein